MSADDPFVLDNIVEEMSFEGYEMEDIFQLMELLKSLQGMGSSWRDTMYICLLGAAISANKAGMSPDEFMIALRSIKVTEDGMFGEA